MKAVQIVKYGRPDEAFEIKDLPEPEPEKGQITIAVSHFGINYADVMSRKGMYNDAPPIPFVPGYEVVGTVKKTGSENSEFKVGERVLAFTLFGGYAQVARADERTVVRLPDDVDAAQATALATQYCTAYYAAFTLANVQKGENVLIHACAGGVGQGLLELCLWKGCNTAGTAGSDQKIEFIKNKGVHFAVNYTAENFVDAVRKHYDNSKPVDAAFDAVGGKVYKNTEKLMRYGGRHVLFGVASRKGDSFLDKIKLIFDFGFTHPVKFLMKSTSLMGLNMLRVAEVKPYILGEMMGELIQLKQKGVIDPYVGAVYDAADIKAAHTLMEERKSTGKVVLKW